MNLTQEPSRIMNQGRSCKTMAEKEISQTKLKIFGFQYVSKEHLKTAFNDLQVQQ
jgi:hypothetical protein